MTIYLLPVSDGVSEFYDKSYIPEELLPEVIEVEELPEGPGILKIDEHGQLYREIPVEETPAPVEPQPTLEEMQMQTLVNTEYLVVMSELSNL